MKEIQLSRGYKAIVDDEDYDRLSQWRWNISTCNGGVYPTRGERIEGTKPQRRRVVRMHVEIMNPPAGMLVDHINGDTLDNRRCNLRVCTKGQNQMNMRRNSRNTSGYRGVHWNKKNKKWTAIIRVANRKHYLGLFESVEAAATAYAEASRKYHGEFGRPDLPQTVLGFLAVALLFLPVLLGAN